MSSTGPNLGLHIDHVRGEDWFAGDAADRKLLDTVVQGAVLARQNAPPGSPVAGARYIVGTAPTGAWTGHANAVAVYLGATWLYYTPKAGWRLWDAGASVFRYFDGTAWLAESSTGGGVPEAPNDGARYARKSLGWDTIPGGLSDAPSNGNQYARKNGAWDIVTGGSGGGIGEASFTVPSRSDFTVFRDTVVGAHCDDLSAPFSGIRLWANGTSFFDAQLIYCVKPLVAGAGGFRATARIRYLAPYSRWMFGGLLLRMTAGAALGFGLGREDNGNPPGVGKVVTHADSNDVASWGNICPWFQQDAWIQYFDDTINRHCYVSADGVTWNGILIEPSGWNSITPDQVGIFMIPNPGGGIGTNTPVGVQCLSFTTEAVP